MPLARLERESCTARDAARPTTENAANSDVTETPSASITIIAVMKYKISLIKMRMIFLSVSSKDTRRMTRSNRRMTMRIIK